MTGDPVVTGAAGDIGRATVAGAGRTRVAIALTDHPSAADRLDRSPPSAARRRGHLDGDVRRGRHRRRAGGGRAVRAETRPAPSALFNNAGLQGASTDRPLPLDERGPDRRVNLEGVVIVLSWSRRRWWPPAGRGDRQHRVDGGGDRCPEHAGVLGHQGRGHRASRARPRTSRRTASGSTPCRRGSSAPA